MMEPQEEKLYRLRVEIHRIIDDLRVMQIVTLGSPSILERRFSVWAASMQKHAEITLAETS
jgi:hypothetical protein